MGGFFNAKFSFTKIPFIAAWKKPFISGRCRASKKRKNRFYSAEGEIKLIDNIPNPW
jgi:hypothetical protein